MNIQIVCVIHKWQNIFKGMVHVDRAKQDFSEWKRTKEKSFQENYQCLREG